MNQLEQALNNTLQVEREEDLEPNEYFSPVQVRFPVNAPELRPPPPPAIMVNFEDENGTDDDKALQNGLRHLKDFSWEPNDLEFYFNQIETKMQSNGVKKQYTKFQILADIIPRKVQDQVRNILRKKETDLGTTAYKQLKTQLLKIFKPADEAAFERAMGRVLTDTPSTLARELVNDLCQHELTGCCCPTFIVGLWKRQLPLGVRQGTAHIKFSAENFENICQVADSIYAQSRPSGVSVSGAPSLAAIQHQGWVSAGSVQEQLNQGFNYNQDSTVASGPVLAAVSGFRGGGGGRRQGGQRSRGGRGRGNRGAGRGASATNSGNPKWPNIPRAPDFPPLQSCRKHWQFGKAARWCEEPQSCPWKQFFTPKENN